MRLIQLMRVEAHFVNKHFVSQVNKGDRTQPSTPAARIWYYMRTKAPTFHCTEVDQD